MEAPTGCAPFISIKHISAIDNEFTLNELTDD
jgi:hypothetical protein